VHQTNYFNCAVAIGARLGPIGAIAAHDTFAKITDL